MRAVLLVIAFAIVLVGGVEFEEDSDVEYATPQMRKPQVRHPEVRRRVEREVESSSDEKAEKSIQDDDDDLGEIAGSSTEEAPATPRPRKMVRRWELQEHFVLEAVFVTILMLMTWRYFAGKADNTRISYQWLQHHLPLLSKQFSLVGDTGNFEEEISATPVLVRESPSNLTLYCSGRRNCISALFRMQLVDRQDLVTTLINFVMKGKDTLTVTFELEERDMPIGFCCAVVPARNQNSYKESCADLMAFATNRGMGAKGLPKTSVLLCDSEAATMQVLTPPIREVLANPLFKSLHITDASPFNDTKSSRVARFEFGLPSDPAQLDELMTAMLHVVDLIPTINVSDKESKLLKQVRSAAVQQLEKQRAQEKEDEIARKRMEKKRKEQEELESRLETLPVDQRRKLEQKIARQQQRKAQNKGKGKMQFLSM